jgi:Winged helix-turn helix
MPKSAQPLTISDQDAPTLRRWTRSSSIRAGLAQRARIVLAAAQGLSNTQIAERVGCSRPTVVRWRGRYAAKGLAGLEDQPRSGRPRTVRRDRRAEIVAVTQQPPPKRLGITHWSTRALARHLGVSRMTVARVWAEHDLKPWRTETFKFSTDPELHAKVEDLCGLYLDPTGRRDRGVRGRKPQIQALDRTAPTLPGAARAGRAAHPRLRPPWGDRPVRRAGARHRQGAGPLLPPASP